MAMKRYLPIRKVAAAMVGAALSWTALQLGLDLGSAEINQAATGLVAVAFAYAVRDPRVVEVLDDVEKVVGLSD